MGVGPQLTREAIVQVGLWLCCMMHLITDASSPSSRPHDECNVSDCSNSTLLCKQIAHCQAGHGAAFSIWHAQLTSYCWTVLLNSFISA